jgi:hypothetical protein
VANINGKAILASGTYLFRTGDRVEIPGPMQIILTTDEAAPTGITVTGQPTGYEISVNGLSSVPDSSVGGSGVFNGANIRINVYAMRAASAGPGQNTYRVDYTFAVA